MQVGRWQEQEGTGAPLHLQTGTWSQSPRHHGGCRTNTAAAPTRSPCSEDRTATETHSTAWGVLLTDIHFSYFPQGKTFRIWREHPSAIESHSPRLTHSFPARTPGCCPHLPPTAEAGRESCLRAPRAHEGDSPLPTRQHTHVMPAPAPQAPQRGLS